MEFGILPTLQLRSSRVDLCCLHGRSRLWHLSVAASLAAFLLPQTYELVQEYTILKKGVKKNHAEHTKFLVYNGRALVWIFDFFLDVSEVKDENGSLWTVTTFNTSLKMSTYLTAFVICDFDYVTRTERGNEVDMRLHNVLQEFTAEVGPVVHHVLWRHHRH